MGAKEILAYRNRETMTAREFLGFWLAEFPADALHEAALVLAEIVQADRACVRIGDSDPAIDVWDDDMFAQRVGQQQRLVAALRRIARERGTIDQVPEETLSRDALAGASETVSIPVARFLLPPRFETPSDATADRKSLKAADCYFTEGFRTVAWYGVSYVFSLQQGRAVEQLWYAWQNGVGLSQKEIGEAIGSRSDNFRLRDLFRAGNNAGSVHPAWNTMIKEVGTGVFALYPPRDSAVES